MSNSEEFIPHRAPPIVAGHTDENKHRTPISFKRKEDLSSSFFDESIREGEIPDYIKQMGLDQNFKDIKDFRDKAYKIEGFLKTLMFERNKGSMISLIQDLKKELKILPNANNAVVFARLFNFFLIESVKRKSLAYKSSDRGESFL